MVFFPDGDNKRCYVVSDVEIEQSILRKLKRIRLAELAARMLSPIFPPIISRVLG
jgi:hypothetical protein